MALELARRGSSDRRRGGRPLGPATFEHDELAMFVRAYKPSGLQRTKDNHSLLVQGATLGGAP